MRSLLVAVVLVPALASAQPGAVPANPVAEPASSTSAEVLGLARGAHAAGQRGDCMGARVLAGRIQRLDPDFYAAVVSTDLSITGCKPKPRVYAVVPDPEQPAVLHAGAPRAVVVPPSLDSGRNIGGQLLVGGVMTAGLGFLGGILGVGSRGPDEQSILLLASLGMIAGSTAGVVFAGDNAGSDYSLGLTLAGSTLGTLVGWSIVIKNDGFDSAGAIVFVLVAAPTLGAMVGFNASRSTLPYPSASRPYALPAAPRISDPTTSLPLFTGSF